MYMCTYICIQHHTVNQMWTYVHTYVLCSCTEEYKGVQMYVCMHMYLHSTDPYAPPPSLTCTHTVTPHMQPPTHTQRICSQPLVL